MNLYLITLHNYDEYYVVAENGALARKKLEKLFDDNDIYFASERKVKLIEFLGEGYYDSKDIFKEWGE